MTKTYFGFAVADSMFGNSNATIRRSSLTLDHVRYLVETRNIIPCLNPSHAATIAAMQSKFGLQIAIPATPPKVELREGDGLICMSVRGLPRLMDRREYTPEEIEKATFAFSLWEVLEES